jgi:glyoxylase-like metal-dependent hydrolase (beta-lactamase superfamily II)
MKSMSVWRSWSLVTLAIVLTVNVSGQYRNRAVKVPGSSKMSSKYVKTGLYLITGEGNNSVVRLSSNGLIIVGDKLPGNYEGLIGRAQKISDQPVRFLVLTDGSKSETGNLAQFVKEGTRLVAQDKIADALLAENAIDRQDAPTILRFDRDRTIHLGGIEVQAIHFGAARSAGDTVVYFPNLKVIAVGEVYSSDPNLSVHDGGSLVQWSSVLDEVLKLDFDTVIPAEGVPVSKAELQAFKAKLDHLVSQAGALVQQGLPKDQLLAHLDAQNGGLKVDLSPEQLDGFYAELSTRRAASR